MVAALLAGNAAAGDLSPETFLRANSEARKLTLDGMEKRIALLQKGATQEQQMAVAEQTNVAIEAIFKKYGTTGPEHTAYSTYHQEQIDAWLQTHPSWKQDEADLNQRFQALSKQIDGLLGGR
jgi:ribosomal protein L31